MRFKAQRNDLLKAITSTIGGVNSKSTLPILNNLLIEAVNGGEICLTGMDLEISIRTTCQGQVEESGGVAVPARKLYDIIRELPSTEVDVTVAKNNAVNIKTAKSFFKIMGLDPADFPKFPEPAPIQSFEVEQKVLKQCLALIAFAISRDEARYTLNGALLILKNGAMRLVATDGKRLASVERDLKLPKDTELEAVIPAKTILELMKGLSGEEGTVQVTQGKNQMIFRLGGTTIASQLIEGRFPNYEQVIPKSKKTSTQLSREELLSAIRRAALLTSQENQSVKLDFIKGKLLISSRSPNLGEAKEELEASISGENLSIGFNPSYLIDVLKNLDVDQVSISLTDPDKPGLIESEGGYQYVVMPMQLA